jgi:hypothetical protein
VTVGGSAAGASAVGVDYRLQAAGVGRVGGVVLGRSWRTMRWRKKKAGGGVGEARGSRAAKAQRCARTMMSRVHVMTGTNQKKSAALHSTDLSPS